MNCVLSRSSGCSRNAWASRRRAARNWGESVSTDHTVFCRSGMPLSIGPSALRGFGLATGGFAGAFSRVRFSFGLAAGLARSLDACSYQRSLRRKRISLWRGDESRIAALRAASGMTRRDMRVASALQVDHALDSAARLLGDERIDHDLLLHVHEAVEDLRQ